eukprot:TRINITY_DN34525_c0_g1_i1.p1 TRINITY_DN34525_c0_g1~~TRINITY_DN34525_c0_g1_i1.p1  ORF type:complete len:514 (+),score=128.65 TRINITY_DN34525_c0_g1_i1:37-1578(+)
MDVLRSRYDVYEQLGKGAYATVYKVVEIGTKEEYAAKLMSKERLGPKGMKQVKGEAGILKELDHPNIVKLKEVIEDDEVICLVMEIINGGELFKRITQLQHYSEKTACELMRNFLKVLAYMHSTGVVHRDLKPDNLLLKESTEDIVSKNKEVTTIKLADFGFATQFKGANPMLQACGTPYYIAPELLQAGVFKTKPHYVPPPCDMWSTGVICYVLLCGYPPFRVPRDATDAKSKLFKLIVKGKFAFDKGTAWDKISPEARDFVSKLLVVDVNQRYTAQQALEHPWFEAQGVRDDHLASSIEEMKTFNGRSKIKGAVYGVEAAFKMLYNDACEKRGAKKNSSLLDQFESATEPLHELDLSNTYLGPKGFDALISVINKHPTLHVLKLQNSLIETEQCVKLCKVLQDPVSCSQIHSIDFGNNPLTSPAGRALLAMMQARRKITTVNLSDTHVSEPLQKKIYAQATRNKAYRETAAKDPVPPSRRKSSGISPARRKPAPKTSTKASTLPPLQSRKR